jgi:hypothetical protein
MGEIFAEKYASALKRGGIIMDIVHEILTV